MKLVFGRIPVGSRFYWFRSFVRRWFRLFLTPDEIAKDVLSGVWNHPEDIEFIANASDYDLLDVFRWFGRELRNTYGLWDSRNPHVKIANAETKDGIITDSKHPDNLSFEILKKVRDDVKTVVDLTKRGNQTWTSNSKH